MTHKLVWQGHILGVQPRIRLYRSFDQRSQTDLGYLLRVEGSVDGEERIFTVGIGPSVQMRSSSPASWGIVTGVQDGGVKAQSIGGAQMVADVLEVNPWRHRPTAFCGPCD